MQESTNEAHGHRTGHGHGTGPVLGCCQSLPPRQPVMSFGPITYPTDHILLDSNDTPFYTSTDTLSTTHFTHP